MSEMSNKGSETADRKLPKIDMTFTKELRRATRKVHNWSNVLVNAKFALALHDDAVWYDGLLAFYEIYKYLEQHLPERLLPKELRRTEAFEQDFNFYYGPNWKENYTPRDSVRKYVAHLEEVQTRNEMLLFAYAYQMYMALMSGGQLLQKKRMIARKIWSGSAEETAAEAQLKLIDEENDQFEDLESRPVPEQIVFCPPGCATTFFSAKIADMKDKLRAILNDNYGKFDEQLRQNFIEESCNVFIYNGEVVRSIKGVNWVAARVGLYVALFAVVIILAKKLFLK